MKVILLTDVPKVGNRYEVKDFKEGYAQNVLLAKGLAELATPANIAKLKDRTEKIERKRQEEKDAFSKIITSIDNTHITISVKANEKGHLFKAVNSDDVVKAIKSFSGVDIDPHTLVLPIIKELGSYAIEIKKGDMKGKCTVVIVK